MMIATLQASAFPTVGVNFQNAIQKQDEVWKKQDKLEGVEFGIMGSFEFKAESHRFQSDWQDAIKRIRQEAVSYDDCESERTCSPQLSKWRALLAELKRLPADKQLARLNTSINRMARYADDSKAFGKPDHWATPLEFLKGKADCEDYALVKFWSLLELGYSSKQLRLAIVRDQRRDIMHAVVTVDTGMKKLVLDSLFDHVVEERYILKYAPIYSANLDSQFAHIVSKQLRVAYLNQLEERAVKVVSKRVSGKASSTASKVFAPVMPAHSLFVDWT